MSGQLSKAKALAYMYQHAETELMNAIDGFLTERGYEVLARVHDAVLSGVVLKMTMRLISSPLFRKTWAMSTLASKRRS